jgi:His-Xaa-Ser system protein HxsD
METRKFIELHINKNLYEKEAVIAAAYSLSGCCVIKIEPQSSEIFKITLEPLVSSKNEDFTEVSHRFMNELNDQQLRLDLERRYGPIRELIVKHAFAPLENLTAEVKKIVGRE